MLKIKPSQDNGKEPLLHAQSLERIPSTLRIASAEYLRNEMRKAIGHAQSHPEALITIDNVVKEIWKPIATHRWKKVKEMSICCRAVHNKENLTNNKPKPFQLNLYIELLNQMTNKSFNILVFHIRENLTHLQELDLSFMNSLCIKDKDLENLGISIGRNLTQLQSLSLHFKVIFWMTDKGLSLLVSGFARNLPMLQQLNLNCEEISSLKDEWLGKVGSEIGRHLTSLQKLSFSFSGCDIKNDGLEKLISKLGKRLNKLKQYDLNLGKIYRRSADMTIKGVAQALGQNFKHIIRLDLDFAEWWNITDLGIESLAYRAIAFLTQLEQLNLNFFGCWQIKDKGVETLSLEMRKSLLNLRQLTLSFKGCMKITGDAVKAVSVDTIRDLAKLKKLSLNFEKCESFTQYGLETTISKITSCQTQLQHLEHFDLYLSSFSESIINKLKKSLHFIPHLSIENA